MERLQQRRRVWTTGGVMGLLMILFAGFYSCDESIEPPSDPAYNDPPPLSALSGDACAKWAEMTLYTLRFSAFNSPTYSSRSLGYMGLAMYESIVPGSGSHKSLNGQLAGLMLPQPEADKNYHWILSMNAGQNMLLKLLYPYPANSHRFIHERIDSLGLAIQAAESEDLDPEVVTRSEEFGYAVATAIFEWSRADGGYQGYSRNFDPAFPFPTGDSYWVPPVRGQTVSDYPLHPHWGSNRAFVAANNALPVPPIIPFSTDPQSEYYQKYYEVYHNDPLLTQEEMEIAAWWGDDPTETFSPPGQSYHMARMAVELSDIGMIGAAEAFARVGMAVADAFIHCWKVKYTYFNERPSSFIKKYIDPNFVQFWPEPPFPAFPSGHSIQASSAATVLTELFGDNFAFTDRIHENHRRYDDIRFYGLRYPARSFTSFWDAAEECAYSRLLGGIHTRQDNDAGMAEGVKVGGNVNALEWRK